VHIAKIEYVFWNGEVLFMFLVLFCNVYVNMVKPSIDSKFNIVEWEMIFEHPFYDNFYDNFISHTHITFYFISYCFGFCANIYFFFVNYCCYISCQPNGCSNNTPQIKRYMVEEMWMYI